MKYKVGDKVRIKSLDWYNRNKDNYGAIYAGNGFCFWKNMSRHCGEIMKITIVKVDPEDSNKGYYFMENCEERWTDEMIEGLVEEGKVSNVNSITQDRVDKLACKIDEELPSGNPYEWECPEGYIFKDENGNVINATKIVLEKKKKEYPKTYKECCEIVGDVLKWDNPFHINRDTHPYIKRLDKLMESFCKLLICRDAYLKVAGKEVGLNKPWEPDWSIYEHKFCLGTDKDKVIKECVTTGNRILAFPTRKMRDEFYENFKEEIEICKELL